MDFAAVRSVEHWNRSPRKLTSAVVLEVLKSGLASSSHSQRKEN